MKSVRSRISATIVAALSLAVITSCGDDSAGTSPTGSISGTITFRGDFPSTGDVLVTVFAQYPPTGAPDSFTNPIRKNQLGPNRTFHYKISGLETGTYKAVLVGWRGGVSNDKCTGLFWAFPDSVGIDADCVAQAPGPLAVEVNKDQDTPNVNMVSNFDLLQP